MASIGYSYGGSDEELYQTDGYGGSDADIDNDPPVDATDGYTSDIDLTDNVEATVDFKFDSSGTTDNLVLYVFKRRNSSWDGDEIALWTIEVSSDGSEDIYNVNISPAGGWSAGHYRFAMQSSGATDTFEIDVQMRRTKYVSA